MTMFCCSDFTSLCIVYQSDVFFYYKWLSQSRNGSAYDDFYQMEVRKQSKNGKSG